ncbi:hypothetical protein H6P81_002882 [Aristolochia fimbriata]|uniref:Uncharacterized protein n=1 Tax=Aristolochia fimbriata TaxID=158543 RepID=A0AAV7FCQ2_ARIFI|nr:hypothetical protein H6P81_002882 [Aristolochia fimbriata]
MGGPPVPPPQSYDDREFSHIPQVNYKYVENINGGMNMVMPQPNTTVANGFPFPPPSPAANASTGQPVQLTTPWTTGLFDCMDDPTNALATAFFPCVTFGQIAEILDKGNSTCATSGIIYAVAPCLLSRGYRKKLRRAFGLVEAPAPDWLTHSLFEWCALCQEYRELNNRGINPALGWRRNVEKRLEMMNRQSSSTMTPPTNQSMSYN